MTEVSHSDLLGDFLGDVAIFGCGVVHDHKLRRWLRRPRLAASAWQLIREAYAQALHDTDQAEQGYRLFIGEGADTFSFLSWDGGDAAPGNWWKSIEEMATKLQRRPITHKTVILRKPVIKDADKQD